MEWCNGGTVERVSLPPWDTEGSAVAASRLMSKAVVLFAQIRGHPRHPRSTWFHLDSAGELEHLRTRMAADGGGCRESKKELIEMLDGSAAPFLQHLEALRSRRPLGIHSRVLARSRAFWCHHIAQTVPPHPVGTIQNARTRKNAGINKSGQQILSLGSP